MLTNCPSCFSAPAQVHLTLGLLPCIACQQRQDKLPSPQQAVEIIPERIKAERQERGDSILQPHFKGELDKRWTDLWGTDAARERGFTEKEIKNAKYVSDKIRTKNYGLTYYKNST
jgi:hypothetical protein